ncbi:MAG: hypothetical protein HC831_20840, partial [Chloroflexia bacterium]|nr:hypothetical protein [Chloroflexia bacterium]
MRVAFHCNHLGIAGTEVAIFDYAKYGRDLLEIDPYFIVKRDSADTLQKIYLKFCSEFGSEKILFYEGFNSVERLLDQKKIDIFYALKSGEIDHVVSNGRKTVIHSVFGANQPHGNVYAY